MWFMWLLIGLLVGHYVIPDLKALRDEDKD